MSDLSPAQLLVVKAWIDANGSQLPDDQAVADAMNADFSPTFTVYRTKVSWDTIMQNGMDWTLVDNLTNGSKYRIWEWMFKNSDNAINPSKANIRAGINATWVGTTPNLAVRALVYGHCVRPATIVEKLFATGSGTAPAQDGSGPGMLVFEGPITAQQIDLARQAV